MKYENHKKRYRRGGGYSQVIVTPSSVQGKRKKVSPKLVILLLSLFLLIGISLSLFGGRIISTVYQIQGSYAEDEGKAIASYQQAVQFEPNSASAYYKLGTALSNADRLDEAIKAYQKAVELDENFPQAYLGLGKALKAQGNYLIAFSAYQKAVENDRKAGDEYAQIFKDLGGALSEKGKYYEAISAYGQAIAINPYDASAYYNLGVAQNQIGNLDEAINNYRKAIRLDYYNGEIYQNLGLTLQKQGKLDEAIAALEKAVVLNPDDSYFSYNLGNALLEKEQVYRAASAYRNAIQSDPNFAQAYSGLAETFYKQGNLDEAISYAEKALKLDPQNAAAYKNICFALHNQGKYDAAMQKCNQALKLNPGLREVKFYLAEVPRQLAFKRNPKLFTYPERLINEPLFKLKRSIVKIILKSEDGWGIGTGWIVKREGNKAWVVTNRHVVVKKEEQQENETIEIEFYSTPPPGQFRKRQTAKIVHKTSTNDWLDLAVLEITGVPKDIQPLTISSTFEEINTSILVIGHPYNQTEWSISEGKITGKTAQKLELSASIAFGSSGSPVLNEKDQVVGLAVGIKLLCHTAIEINPDISCGIAFPIEVVSNRLKSWGII
ncbi:MAG: tetratricopeptide repeat protein [Gomphosphaeria aponina SAG 52.96 = DSM 107014]|uniref:Tetratricopeptide repeat protein n=1 Tax=Gomphosphaeria aponina SAG 52.96 = DSM 107014 TaxID=1521640 RepID=A0A941GQ88_9CHRO|nr:tetratricopeptide repeat protein [Gomphosphaeria aponina SAG 52.96 = DSM 107014]